MEPADLNGRPPRPEPLVDAPAFLFRWHWRLLLAALLTIPFFVPIPRALQMDPIIGGLGDRLHVVLLGLAALFFYWFGPLRGRLIGAALAAAAMGGAIELLQQYVGRHMRWHDVGQDLIGIGIVLGFVTWRGLRSRLGLALMIALILLVPWQMREIPLLVAAQRQAADRFPLLADFENDQQIYLWSEEPDGEATVEIVANPDGQALRLTTAATQLYPAAVMHRFPADWSSYDTLKVDVRVVSADRDAIRGGIVVTDYEGNRENVWAQRNWYADSRWRTISFPLDALGQRDGRPIDPRDVFTLKVYLSRPPVPVELEIDNVRLQ